MLFQDLSESPNIVAVRQTVTEIFVISHFTNDDPYGSFKVKGQGEFGKVVYGFLLVSNNNFGHRMLCLRDICEPFLDPYFDP